MANMDSMNEINRITMLCKEYAPSKRDLIMAERDLDVLNEKAQKVRSEAEARILDFAIKTRKEKLEKDKRIVAEFNSLIKGLDESEMSIITQLYVKGRKWKQVVDEDGKPMHSEKISRIRRAALRNMAERENRRRMLVSDDDELGNRF